MNLTIQQPTKSITQKFKKGLKSQDFVLISQENKEYKQLVKILQEKEAILITKISELQKAYSKLQNQKDEYKAICNQCALKIHQYENIKSELIEEYKMLKNEIDNNFEQIATKDLEIAELQKSNGYLQQSLMQLEQKAKTDNLVIEELRQHIGKLQKDIMDKKITIFSHLVDYKPKQKQAKSIPKKQNIMNKSNIKNGNSNSFKASTIYQSSKNNSNTNSISFSLVSNESMPRQRESITKKHNKSIYL